MKSAPRVHRATPADRADDPPASPRRKVEQILRAASRLFLKRGFEAVTMDEVAKTAVVSKSTLYLYFSSKEDLFATVMREEAHRVNQQIWTPGDGSGDVEAVLRQVARNFFSVFLTERSIAFKRMLLGAMARFPKAGRIVYESGPGQVADNIASFLSGASRDGRLVECDPHFAARQFLSLLRGDFELGMVLSMPPPTNIEIERSIEETIRMFMARYGRN